MMAGGDQPSLAQVLDRYVSDRAAAGRPNILEALLAIQEALGAVPPHKLPDIAGSLGATEAQVAGVLSYYPELHTAPPGRHLVRVCTGESCVANHCSKIVGALQDGLKITIGQTTADGRFTLERVYCVGNCAVGPTLMVDEDVHGRVSPSDVPALLEAYR
jgi:NADH:ubiquinone oxidoreductase subunit E